MGAGAIGKEIAVRAKAFGLIVRGYDPYLTKQEGFDCIYGKDGGMERLLNESDFVVTSLPVTNETRDIINAKTLAMMKPTAVIVNTARGGIIDEDALYDALKAHQIRGAALDVFAQEPLPNTTKLRELDNIILTPHVSSQTYESLWNIYKMAIDIAADHFAGKDSPHILNPEYKQFNG
jgi:phosphoglycerate dehydrogenase-like enzyme